MKKIYVLILRNPKMAFEFSTKKNRAQAIKDIKTKMPLIEFATAEIVNKPKRGKK